MKSFKSIILLGIFLRWSVSLFPYSGAGKQPMYGDYEAQRHWQEITVNLPIENWYRNSSNNDLMYWGLDYPPLTAYHSYLCGNLAKFIDPKFITINSSRGFESYTHKFFMRSSVFIMDLLIYFPASYFYSNLKHIKQEKADAWSSFSALILYPGLYLIDYGHFQYNNISLGLFTLTIAFLLSSYDIFGAMCFVFALNYKQMELYHALPIFVFYLGKYYKSNSFILNIAKIGITVILTFIICWFPFLFDLNSVKQVLVRIFPFNRGLFEDKVASFWCSASIIIKFKDIFGNAAMSFICLTTTSVLLLPSCSHLFYYPKHKVFIYSLINCSLIFFLFSFHVHEKSILLVALPICFIYHEEPMLSTWFFILSILSMLPLLIKDGLVYGTVGLIILCLLTFPQSHNPSSRFSISNYRIAKFFIKFSIVILLLLSLMKIFVQPPNKYPDLYDVLISFYSCAHFCLFLMYFHYCQYCAADYNI